MLKWIMPLVLAVLFHTVAVDRLAGGGRSEQAPKANQADWPQWRGPNRDNISAEAGWNPKALAKGPKILWQAEVGKGFSCVAIQADRLYTLGNTKNEDTVYCLSVTNGKQVWKHTYACRLGSHPGPRATPTVDGDRLYTLSREGHLFCLEAESGKVVWQKHLVDDFGAQRPEWGFAGSPVVWGELLLLNALRSGLALDKADGSEVWASEPDMCGYATPTIAGDGDRQIMAVFGARALHGVEIETGRALWSFPWDTPYDVNAADPLPIGSGFFISSDYGVGGALIEAANNEPRQKWSDWVLGSHFSGFVYFEGHIYGNFADANAHIGRLSCVDAETGERKWDQNMGVGSLMLADDKLILLNERGKLAVAKATPKGYEQLSSCDLPRDLYWTPPVLLRGKIYCRNRSGELYCVDVRR